MTIMEARGRVIAEMYSAAINSANRMDYEAGTGYLKALAKFCEIDPDKLPTTPIRAESDLAYRVALQRHYFKLLESVNGAVAEIFARYGRDSYMRDIPK